LFETYDAQVVGALREIDETLRFVAYAVESGGASLSELRDRGLLPPEILFAVTIQDAAGDLVASTDPPSAARALDRDSFTTALQSDELCVGRPRRGEGSEWMLDFRRRLGASDESAAGVATI